MSLDNSLVNVSVQADALARHAFGLAERGALYSARSEFIQTLRVVAQGLDTTRGVNEHSRALASGLRALKAADDFMPRGARLEADLDLERLIATHRTPVLQSHDVSQLTPVAALQRAGRDRLRVVLSRTTNSGSNLDAICWAKCIDRSSPILQC